jgi:hypothetical protein
MHTSAQTIYLNEGIKEIQRLISLQDRESFSKTYGCFDRTYWCWKFTDFPGARFQEGVYALAFLFTHPFPDNPYAGSEKVLGWALAGMRFWQSIQYDDGSFDEAYPEEHSLAATAFTTFYIGEAFALLRPYIKNEEESERMTKALARAGRWLCKNDERHGILSNHLAAAAAALQTLYNILGAYEFQERSRYFLDRIYQHSSSEGWYEEYGGADPGYQTHAAFYLAKIWKDTRDSKLLRSLKKSIAFLKHCFHPNGTLGGEYGSRNTEFYFPAGFEILAEEIPDARLIVDLMRPSVASGAAAGVHAMDAYNFCPLLNNYFFAAANAVAPKPLGFFSKTSKKSDGVRAMPCKREGEWCFEDAGLFFKSTPSHYIIVGLSKGGVLKVYDRLTGRLIASDCGYWAKTEDGKVISSQTFRRHPECNELDEELVVKTNFSEVNRHIFSPWLFMGFRTYSLLFGKIREFAYFVKKLLVDVLIRRRKKMSVLLKRVFRFERDQLVIFDEIRVMGNVKLSELRREAKFGTIHMGSARYFQCQELDTQTETSKSLLSASADRNVMRFEQRIHLATSREAKAQ